MKHSVDVCPPVPQTQASGQTEGSVLGGLSLYRKVALPAPVEALLSSYALVNLSGIIIIIIAVWRRLVEAQ